MLKRILGCLIALAICVPPSPASSKLFPAHKGSVQMENSYADSAGILQFRTRNEIAGAVDAGTLVNVPITVSPRLPEFRRYVRPAAAAFMLELDTRFYLATGRFLIVDSAVRPADVQRQVARRNRNAAPATGERASSHERGTTFDLAKKTFSYSGFSRMRKGQYRWLLTQLAYYQAIGRIHVIEERACLHIMVREDHEAETIVTGVMGELADPGGL